MQSGRLDEALQVADEGRPFGNGTDLDRVRLHLAAASVERLLGRHDAALRRLRGADRHQRAGWPPDVMAALAISAYERGDYDGAWRAGPGRPARRVGRSPGQRRGRCGVLALGSPVRRRVEAEADAEAERRRAGRVEATDAELAAHAELMIAVPWALVAVERLEDALLVAQAGLGAPLRAPATSPPPCRCWSRRCSPSACSGGSRRPPTAADRTEVAARLTRNDQSRPVGAVDAGLGAARPRRPGRRPRRRPTESVALAEHLDQSALVTIGNAVLGSVLLAAGRPERGASRLIAAYDVEPGWVCRWAPRLVEAELALGDVEGAAGLGRPDRAREPPASG